MAPTTLIPCLDGIQVDSIAAPNNAIVVRLSTVAPYVACPLCGYQTAGVHSRYARTLADMPWNHVAVRIHVRSPAESPFAPPPSRTLAWWLQGHLSSRPEVAAQQKHYLEHLYERDPVLQEAGELAQEFARTLKSRSGTRLDAWLESARQSGCVEIRQFAQGLCQDLAAVRNAVTSVWSNGQTEGQVNRLKMLKRQI